METNLRGLFLIGRIGRLSVYLEPLWILVELIRRCLLEGEELGLLDGRGLLTAVFDGRVADLA